MEPKVKFKGGGSFVTKPPQFSSNNELLYVAWQCSIISYSTKTGKRLKEFGPLNDPIVGFSVHSIDNKEHITACSETGEIALWQVDIGFRILKVFIPEVTKNVETFNLATPFNDNLQNVKFLLSWNMQNKDREVTCFGLYNILNKNLRKLSLRIPKQNYKLKVAICNGSNPHFAVCHGIKLYFVKLNTNKQYIHYLEKSKYFTCLACHPEEEFIITGDSLGRVLLWYNLTNKTPSYSVYHWHTLPVNALSFSNFGTNFFSGANECVLVKWNIENSHYKQFLPRLPSYIEQIIVANTNQFMAVTTRDNAIRILDSQFETVSVIQHLVLSTHSPAGIVFDNSTKSMVLNGLTGHVQFYSPHDMTLLYNLDIVGQNQLTQERHLHIENTNITKIAIDDCGLWLATVEERIDVNYSFELRLKFWSFNVTSQVFELNTSVEFPHEKSITHVLFQPTNNKEDLKCVTLGKDCKFKIWELVNADTVYRKGDAWNCTKIGFYRDLSCNSLSFTTDGSLMGVGFGPTVTTWLPTTCTLKCSLVHPSSRKPLTALHFGISSQCHLLVAATCEQLCVWNLLTLSMLWTVPLHVSLLVSNPLFPHMAVFTITGKLFIFYPNSPKFLYKLNLDKKFDNVTAAVFVPSITDKVRNLDWYKGSQLFFINSRQEMYCLDAQEDQNEVGDIFSSNQTQSLFSVLIPKTKSSVQQIKPVEHLTNISSNNKQLKTLLDAPLHTMVPVRLMCKLVLRSLISEYKTKTTNIRN